MDGKGEIVSFLTQSCELFYFEILCSYVLHQVHQDSFAKLERNYLLTDLSNHVVLQTEVLRQFNPR